MDHISQYGFPEKYLVMSVQSVNRAVDILSLFTAEKTRLGITEIANLLGLSKTTIHGLVRTLVGRSFLQQDPETRKYMLGLRIYELGSALAASLKINQMGSPMAHSLAEAVGLSVRLALWDSPAMVVTFNAFPGAQTPHMQQMGPRVPCHCSAIGKAVLAALEPEELSMVLDQTNLTKLTNHTITDRQTLVNQLEIFRNQGYSEECEEFMLGLACYGAVIKGSGGAVVGSISVSGLPQQVFQGDRSDMPGRLMAAADAISRSMGYMPTGF